MEFFVIIVYSFKPLTVFIENSVLEAGPEGLLMTSKLIFCRLLKYKIISLGNCCKLKTSRQNLSLCFFTRNTLLQLFQIYIYICICMYVQSCWLAEFIHSLSIYKGLEKTEIYSIIVSFYCLYISQCAGLNPSYMAIFPLYNFLDPYLSQHYFDNIAR